MLVLSFEFSCQWKTGAQDSRSRSRSLGAEHWLQVQNAVEAGEMCCQKKIEYS